MHLPRFIRLNLVPSLYRSVIKYTNQLSQFHGRRRWGRLAGFTLIELLVVVLIIGILAAIALPQYQAAVEKSRMATVMSNTKYLKNELEVYYLANSTYPPDLSLIDTAISGCSLSADKLRVTCKDSYYHFIVSGMAGVVRLFGQNYTSVYYQGLDYRDKGTVQCWGQQRVASAQRMCQSLGGVFASGPSGEGWMMYNLNQ